jgi:hypothetical protein
MIFILIRVSIVWGIYTRKSVPLLSPLVLCISEGLSVGTLCPTRGKETLENQS